MSFKRAGLKAAVVGATLAISLGAMTSTAFADPNLASVGPNSSNTRGVMCVQDAVNLWGGYGHLDVDGVFGQKTYNAVMAYQSAHNLSSDGIVGQYTGSSMWNQPGFSMNEGNCWSYMPTLS
ncbi:peptidoglycan-binding domain-containing protein [Kitasatospora aureofaciens]|uniref:peptidoglycan-binding domain-containing protein n=1 Tax=Kitasatospora aureofaciens TaxID=1894 RepID=UPI0033FE1775